MIFSFLLRRLFVLLLFAVVPLSPDDANAQCPGGRPPNRDGSCGSPQENKPVVTPPKREQPRQRPPRQNSSGNTGRPRNKNVAGNCSIDVRVTRQGGDPLAAVTLTIDDAGQSSGITNAAGIYKFNKLPCKRSYKIIPGHAEYTFNLASITINNLTKNGSAAFIASAREKIASKEETRPCNPPPKTLPRIRFDDSLTGKLSPQTSFCDENTKGYFHSYQLDGALGGDIIQFDLQSEPASNLIVQVIDQAGSPIEAGAEGESDDPLGRQMVLPAAGDYTVRVIDSSNRASDYRLSVTRKGLTDEGYRGQLERAYTTIAEPDRPTFYSSLHYHLERIRPFSDGKASEQKINEATAILERLRDMVPDKPEAISMLAAIQLYYRKDLVVARDLATKALELGGEARFRVNFGEKLDKDQRRVTDSNSPCWLIIRKGKVSCESFKSNKDEVFTSTPQWIAKKSLDIPSYYFGLTIYGGRKKESKNDKQDSEFFELGTYYFVPLSSLDLNTRFPLTEVSTIKNFIKDFVEIRKEKTKEN
jgi:hypothetical protein